MEEVKEKQLPDSALLAALDNLNLHDLFTSTF